MIASQTYEADGQTKAITYANGVTTSFTYSPTRRWVERIVTKNSSGVALLDSQYVRDVMGKIVYLTGLTPADSWYYAYDELALRQAQEAYLGLQLRRHGAYRKFRLFGQRQHAVAHA